MQKLKKAREDVLVMLVVAMVCVLFFFWGIPAFVPVPAAAANEPFTPRTMPYLLTVGIGICTTIDLIKAMRNYCRIKKELTECPPEVGQPKTRHEQITDRMPYIIFSIVAAYGILISKVGFILSSVIVIPVVLFIIGCRKWHYYGIVYIFAAIMWAIFKLVLKVQLP